MPEPPLDIPAVRPHLAGALDRLLAPLERLVQAVYGSAFNPLHHSGTLAALCLVLTLPTGVYMLCFYRVSDPYQSVQALHGQVWLGRWIQALHRYAADGALVFTALHALRMLLRGKTWGPRALAWLTGLALVGAVLGTGWTGLVLVWDRQGQLFAMEGVRLIDLLPLFSVPIGRMFVDATTLPRSFFFMNLFLHVALPLGVALLMWLHTSRVARPVLWPSRALSRWTAGLLVAASVLWPLHLLPPADLSAVLGEVPVDVFYGFWIPLSRAVSPGVHLLAWLAATAAAASVPLWWRPRARPEPSQANPDLCTGCTQCYQDCPYDAIRMVPRTEPSRMSQEVAQVDPALCVSCGICAASCGPMSIGPPGRNGRSQLVALEGFFARRHPGPRDVVVFACGYGVAHQPRLAMLPGVHVYPVACAGSLHTSMIEQTLRRGVAGVAVLPCLKDDALHREGPRWLDERVYQGREADLKERVDRQRVRVVPVADVSAAVAEVRAFQADLGTLVGEARPGEPDLDCRREVSASA